MEKKSGGGRSEGRRTCRPMSGGSSVSASCGYCESHEMSAPRSIMPITSSSTVDALPSA